MKNQKLKISGKTINGQLVVQGCFTLYGSCGIPLDIIISEVYNRNHVIDWIDFFEGAKKDGVKSKTLFSKLEVALTDCFNKQFKDEIIRRLREYEQSNSQKQIPITNTSA